MVVSEESDADTTIGDTTKYLQLDYGNNENIACIKDSEEGNKQEFADSKNEEAILIDNNQESKDKSIEYENKIVDINKNDAIESGIEIQYTSLKLKKLPIVESNFPKYIVENETVNLGNATIEIGNNIVYNVALKIKNYSRFKLLELRTREFKILLCVKLLDDKIIVKSEDFFKYEIFKIKDSRFFAVVDLFKDIFSGARIKCQINNLMIDVSFENRMQLHKFNILKESIDSYKKICDDLGIGKNNSFNDMTMDFYTLYLLNQFHNNVYNIETWLNFKIQNTENLKSGDKINFIKNHELNLKGVKFGLKESIEVLDPLVESDFKQDNYIACYRKKAIIKIEKIEK